LPLEFLDCRFARGTGLADSLRALAWGLAKLLYFFEGYCLDCDRRELRLGSTLIDLEPQVFDLLEYVVRNRARVVSRDDLITSVWGGRIVSESALNTRINAARNAIGDSGAEQRLIKTLPRKGIRFVAAVREETADRVPVGVGVPREGPGLRQEAPSSKSAWPTAVTTVAMLALGVLSQTQRWWQPLNPSAGEVTAALVEPGERSRQRETLVPQQVPFIPDGQRDAVAMEYLSAPDHKALAISSLQAGFITEQKDDETAKAAALDLCQRQTDRLNAKERCEIYAVGNTVVSALGRPPMPPVPWVVHDPSVEAPFTIKDLPLIREGWRPALERILAEDPKPWALAVPSKPQGAASIYYHQSNDEEAVRRALEACGATAGVPCLVVAVDNVFVVPIPTTMKITGLLRAGRNAAIAQDAREDVARRLANAGNGWNAVAAGAEGHPGVALKAADEERAIEGALADCRKQDLSCRVIAIGPFTVEPK
jgi:DNA-binding winged helix-turn-helix (wHTH) protein